MRTLLAVIVAAILASSAWAGVTATVYRADEKTPLPLVDQNVPDVYRDIMVGTRLTIFISSDILEGWQGWQGMLRIPEDELGIGRLSARDYDADPNLPNLNYEDSVLEAAGQWSVVGDLAGDAGFDLIADFEAIPGGWFVLDYHAEAVGQCDVEFLHYWYDWSTMHVVVEPLQLLSFTHVPSRDFNNDTVVDFSDFASLASQWGQVASVDPNLNGSPDLNADGMVDAPDLALFSDYWLARTDFVAPNEPIGDPNGPAADL